MNFRFIETLKQFRAKAILPYQKNKKKLLGPRKGFGATQNKNE
jgi:hypothetical protein